MLDVVPECSTMLHMRRIGVRELRLNASKYLERVEAGESVEITKRGRVIAVISPARRSEDGREYLIATGQMLPGSGDIRDVVPAPRHDRSVSEVLAELRADER